MYFNYTILKGTALAVPFWCCNKKESLKNNIPNLLDLRGPINWELFYSTERPVVSSTALAFTSSGTSSLSIVLIPL